MTDRPASWLRQGAKRGLAVVLPRRWYLVRGPRRGNAVCLTFDDGPHPEHTPRVLDALAAAGVRATFFLIGREAERHPALVRRVVEEGHAIGNHSYSHPVRRTVSAREFVAEAVRAAAVLADLTGAPWSLYRPPLGQLTARDLWRLPRVGLTTVLWNIDPKDYGQPDTEELRRWVRAHPLRGGDLVLLHDGGPNALPVLPELIARTRDRGLTFTTVAAWTV